VTLACTHNNQLNTAAEEMVGAMATKTLMATAMATMTAAMMTMAAAAAAVAVVAAPIVDSCPQVLLSISATRLCRSHHWLVVALLSTARYHCRSLHSVV
jgi:hypothetical protein